MQILRELWNFVLTLVDFLGQLAQNPKVPYLVGILILGVLVVWALSSLMSDR